MRIIGGSMNASVMTFFKANGSLQHQRCKSYFVAMFDGDNCTFLLKVKAATLRERISNALVNQGQPSMCCATEPD